jgi:hypothetical protein
MRSLKQHEAEADLIGILPGDPTTTLAHLTVCDEFEEYCETKRAPIATVRRGCNEAAQGLARWARPPRAMEHATNQNVPNVPARFDIHIGGQDPG